MRKGQKALRWMDAEIRTPPFSKAARVEAGERLRDLQDGEMLSMPISRPMPSIGPGCHELRIRDAAHNWRILYFLGDAEIVILNIFTKTTQATPTQEIEKARKLKKQYIEEKERG